MPPSRFGFLPAFFTSLAIAFTIAVVVRIRSYDAESGTVPVITERSTASPFEGAGTSIDPTPTSDYGQPPGQQTMTLVEVQDATPVPPRASTAPAEAPPAEAEKPSILSRLLEPFTRGEASAASAGRVTAAPPAQRVPSSSAQQQASSQPRNSRERSSSGEEPPKESDITSDSTAPRLLSIEFNPPQIRDGEETMLVMQAMDDLSGIRSISGTIMAPSGAVQGFAGQREGETNRFFSRVVVPKDAAEGVWAVNYLNLMDNASNAGAVTAAQGTLPPTASFRVVSSRPDSQGPTLKAIWIDKRAMRGGEKNMVFVQAEDDKSGLNLISGIFQSPSRAARVGFVCRASVEVSWSCEFNAPECADCGQWQLEQLQLQDKANNMTTLRAQANEMVATIRVDISSDLCDANPPSVQALTLDQTVVSNIDQSTIAVTATLGDDQCGVMSVSGQAVGPSSTSGQPPRLYFSFSAAGDQHTWVGRVVVPRLAAKGLWRISFLQVLDRGQNLKTYSQNDPVLATAVFTVQ